jgi:hypothetical protein
MSAVRKIRKEAGKGHLVITPRKKGEHVPRKLFLRDGTRLDVLIEERPVQNVHVEKVVTEWQESTNPHANVFHAKPLYLRAEAYLPGNHDVRLAIVDQNDIRFINGCGEQRLCLVKMPASTLRKLPNSDVWMIGDKYKSTVYRVEPSVALGKFFAQNDWSKLVRLWLTENLDKDSRLMEAFKTTVIPLIPQNWKVDSELSKLMFYQNHQFWITNSKSGKSEYPRLVGEIPSNEWTSSGLWGGTVGEERVYGVLEGYGLHFFDEVMYIRNVNSETLLPQLLSYLQQGTASRSLKSRIDCRGTKAVIFASNPTDSSDMLSSVVDFIKVVAGIEFPEKVGSRIGMLLVGNDFRTVAPGGNISDYRDVVHRVVMQIVQKYYFSRIYPILKMNMEWADSVDEIKNTYEAFSVACPHETVKQFIHGMGLAIPKLKMGVIRSLMLEHLDKLVLSSDLKLFQRTVIEKEREQRLRMLVDINLKSFAAVSAALEKIEPTQECALRLRAKFPNMGSRPIALLMGDVSKSTVAGWLKEDATE